MRYLSSGSGGLFIAVGNGGVALSSATGSAPWTSLNTGTTNNLYDVATNDTGRLLVGDQEVRFRALAAALTMWFVVMLAVFAYGALASAYTTAEDPVPFERILFGMGGIAMLVALAPAILTYWVAINRGIVLCGMSVRAGVLTLLFPMQCYALWVTYSRGAMLSLAAAVPVIALLWHLDESRLARFTRRFSRAAAVGVILLALAAWLGFVGAGLSAQAPAAAPTPAPTAPAQAPGAEVTDQGINLSAADLLDPSSLGLRLTYWKVGLRMFSQYPGLGVGLGNFGVAYPIFQYIGAGDVRIAHNAYLQAFCETGLFGGLLLAAFWGYFLVWGAWRIAAETERPARLLLLGLYGGILAFLLHSFIDIHFSHPSLMMFLMIFTGLFYATAWLNRAPRPQRSTARSQIAALALLVLTALAVGMSLRTYRQDLALARMNLLELTVNSDDEMMRRFHVAQFLLRDVGNYAWQKSQGKAPKGKLRIPYMAALDLIPDQSILEQIGPIYAPLPDTAKGMRKMEAGETIPVDAALTIEHPWYANDQAWQASFEWVRQLEAIDAWFPHRADLAVHVTSWYNFIANNHFQKKQEDRRPECLAKVRDWAEEALRRSPLHADMHANYAHALWALANSEPSEKRFDYFTQALDHFREAARLAAATAGNRFQYATALEQVSVACRQAGKEAEAERWDAEAEKAKKDAERVTEERKKLHLE